MRFRVLHAPAVLPAPRPCRVPSIPGRQPFRNEPRWTASKRLAAPSDPLRRAPTVLHRLVDSLIAAPRPLSRLHNALIPLLPVVLYHAVTHPRIIHILYPLVRRHLAWSLACRPVIQPHLDIILCLLWASYAVFSTPPSACPIRASVWRL